jgi:hypothetical protein
MAGSAFQIRAVEEDMERPAGEEVRQKMMEGSEQVTASSQWLLASDEPWTRYRVLVDLLDRPGSDPEVQAARTGMLAHPRVQDLMAQAATWGDRPLKRHNDASHPIYAFSVLADFGLRASDPGLEVGLEKVLAHQAVEGAFQSVLNIAPHYGGTGEDTWSWLLCDAPTLLYALLAFGLGDEPRVRRAVEHLIGLVDGKGWRCLGGEAVGRFHGPGRKDDPCPIANVYALKALALMPDLVDSRAARTGAEMLLGHWERQAERKLYLFGIGSDFRKLKYPFVWYDVLHVADVLSRFPFVHVDPRFGEMVEAITAQADANGRYTAGSMYQAWKGWSFADKKNPSPWLTFLVRRILHQLTEG